MASHSESSTGLAPPRRRLPTDQRRQEFINAALHVLSTQATSEFTMNEVARRANASRALLYHYFSSKRDLMRAVVAHESKALAEALEGSELPHALNAYLAYVDAHPQGYRLLHGGGLLTDPEISAVVEETRERVERLVAEHLEISQTSQLGRLAVRAWTGAVIAVCLEWAIDRRPDREAVHSLLMAMLPMPATPK